MIPKVIHYCWFGNDRKPELINRCINSWKQIMPEYNIKLWGMDSFNFDSVPFVKQAIQKKKWAFAADYVRLYALYTEGGIYLDTDVEVFKSLDQFLSNSFFAGTDTRIVNDKKVFFVESAIMGAEKGNEYISLAMKYYQNREFILPDGTLDITMIPDILSNILDSYDSNYKREDIKQKLKNQTVIYPTNYFANSNYEITKELYAKHWNTYTWRERGKFYSFCAKYDLMGIYSFLEKIRLICTNSKETFKNS